MDAGYQTKESHSFHVELFLEVRFKLKQEANIERVEIVQSRSASPAHHHRFALME